MGVTRRGRGIRDLRLISRNRSSICDGQEGKGKRRWSFEVEGMGGKGFYEPGS